jgi:hypothetical protein
MKKTLLSLFLLCAVFLGKSQVVLNELYTDPPTNNSANRQFFELYNSGTTSENLDCYTLLAFFGPASQNSGTIRGATGFFVIDLPNYELLGRSYFTGAGSNTPSADGTAFTPTFSWNQTAAQLASIGASFKIYRVTGTNYNYNNGGKDTTSQRAMFFNDKNNTYSVFLFKNGQYVNGFVSGLSSGELTNVYRSLPALTITNSCGNTSTIKWSNTPTGTTTVPSTEFITASTGNDHGYYRAGDGVCGLWNKMTVAPTPGRSNPVSTTVNESGAIETENEKIICNTTVSFTVKKAIDLTALPLTVELYYDKGTTGVLDNLDELQPNPIQITTTPPVTGSFTIPQGQKVLLVYRTKLGCISRIFAPTLASGVISSTQTITCEKRVTFTLTATGDAVTYGFPLMANLLAADGSVLGSKRIESYSANSSYFIDLASSIDQDVSLEYKALNYDCFSKPATVASKVTSIPLTIEGNYLVGTNTVSYSITNTPAIEAYPIQVGFYEDPERDGLSTGQTPKVTHTINTPQETKSFTDNLDNSRSDAIVIVTPFVCASVQQTFKSEVILPVKLISFNAKRSKEKVHLTWQTATEVNNSGFDIQRKLPNGEWKTIAFMFSKANDGNSNSILSYEYTDIHSTKGVTQYRLRQVDIDTRSTFSEIRSVHGLEQASRLLVYPNPSTDGKVNIVFDDQQGSRNIIVSDMAGRVVKQFRDITDNSLQIDHLQNGIYTLKITNAQTGTTTVEKLIIKKR